MGFALGAAWYIWGPKVKIDYLAIDAKLILININNVKKKIFKKFFKQKKFDKIFHTCWYDKLIIKKYYFIYLL